MKQCPLCGAGCFEDMDTCYCCMYRFSDPADDEGSEGEADAVNADSVCAVEDETGPGELTPRREAWSAGAGIPDTPLPDADAPRREGPAPCAFGPQIEHLPGVGRCVRIDIPLRAIRSVMEEVASEPVTAA